jgi:hypothetical protein
MPRRSLRPLAALVAITTAVPAWSGIHQAVFFPVPTLDESAPAC